MTATSKRLQFLEKLVGDGSRDPFAHYGLAMEYRGAGRPDDALRAFEGLRALNPDYVPMFLMCGQLLEGMGRTGDAREWLTEGVARARAKGDAHTVSELEEALAHLG